MAPLSSCNGVVSPLVRSSWSGAAEAMTSTPMSCTGTTTTMTHSARRRQCRATSFSETSRISPNSSGRRPGFPAIRPEDTSSPAGHRRQDDERVALLDGRAEAVEDAHVLVVEVDVHVAVQRPVGAEQLGLGRRVLL